MIVCFEPGGEDVHLDVGYPHNAGPMFESRLEREGFPTNPKPKMQNLLALGVGEALTTTTLFTDRLEAMQDALAEWRETGDPGPVLELVE